MESNKKGFTLVELMTSVIIMGIVLILLIQFYDKSENESVIQEEVTTKGSIEVFDFSKVITNGNFSYIPIDKSGTPDERVQMILQILNDFAKKNPQIAIKSWQIEKIQKAHSVSPKIYGIWIYHSPIVIDNELKE